MICIFMVINETKKLGKSWNNYSPPPTNTHTSGVGGGGLIRLTLHPKTTTNGCKTVKWDH